LNLQQRQGLLKPVIFARNPVEWKLGLLWNEAVQDWPVSLRAVEMVKGFLATRREHRYARSKRLKYGNPNDSEFAG
jgi:hypothetical protein